MKIMTKLLALTGLALALCGGRATLAATVTINSGTTDQTAYFMGQVNSLHDGDTLVIASGNHYISAFININFNNGTINASGAVVRKVGGSTSGLSLFGNGDTVNNLEIDGGGSGTNGPCMMVANGTGCRILNCYFHNSGNDSGLLMNNTHMDTIQGCRSYYNWVVGISQSGCTDETITNCQMVSNGAEGLTIDNNTPNCHVTNCWIHANNLAHRGVGGVGIDGANGVIITQCTIDGNGSNGITFQNNDNLPDDGCNIYSNPNISNNAGYAVGIFKSHLVTHFGFTNNVMTGNSSGNYVAYFSS